MKILSHRGLWHSPDERNKREAFERSFSLGFGTETDLRDICGKIVISHDMPQGNELTFEEMLEIMDGRNLPLALNIKADGQADEIQRILRKYNHTNYFTFDMSIPDMVVQMDRGVTVFTGQSDIMPNPVLLEKAAGVWLDSFYSEWFTEQTVQHLLDEGKKVCIVSADLHKRDVAEQWQKIKGFHGLQNENLMLCTDRPEDAANFFGVKI